MKNKISSLVTCTRWLLGIALISMAPPAFSQYSWAPPAALNSDAVTDNVSGAVQSHDVSLDLAGSETGTVVGVWLKGNGKIVMSARSTDFGGTWSDPVSIGSFSPPGFYNWEPEVIYSGQGRWFVWSGNGYSSYSTDDGQTWSIPVAFDLRARAIATNGAGMMMKTSLPSGSEPTPITQSFDGGITWSPVNTIPASSTYHIVHSGGGSWFITAARESPYLQTYTFHTEDNGLTWEELAPTDPLNQMANYTSDHQGTMMTIATVGMAYGMWSTDRRSETFSRTSYDNGRTWTINSIESAPLYQMFLRHVANVEWVGENRYVAVWSRHVAEPAVHGRYDTSCIFTAYTDDAGQSWSAPVQLTPDATAPPGVGYVQPKIAGNYNNVVAGWHSVVNDGASDPVYGSDSDIFYSVGFDEPVAPPPPPPPPPPGPVVPAANLSGAWAPAQAKYKTSKNGQFKGRVKAAFLVCNTGNLKLDEKSTVRFYLSADPVLDFGDIELKPKKVGKLKPGKGKSAKVKINKLAAPVTGQYLFAIVDADMTITESSEADNIIMSAPLP